MSNMYSYISVIFVAILVLLSSSSNAFAPSKISSSKVGISSSTLSAFPVPDFLQSDETLSPAIEAARTKFWFYFFAGSGAGGIGAAQLPTIFREAGVARSAAGTGNTLGGDALNAGPLVGFYYKNNISEKDIADVIKKSPTAEFISSRSTSVNYMASKGYIEVRDFIKEMGEKGCNPLASYVVFDSISSGKGGVVSPIVYEDTLSTYRSEISTGDVVPKSFVGDLNKFLAVKVAAFIGLVVCLLFDLFLVGKAYLEGFVPDSVWWM